jgi:hypothetical protein
MYSGRRKRGFARAFWLVDLSPTVCMLSVKNAIQFPLDPDWKSLTWM